MWGEVERGLTLGMEPYPQNVVIPALSSFSCRKSWPVLSVLSDHPVMPTLFSCLEKHSEPESGPTGPAVAQERRIQWPLYDGWYTQPSQKAPAQLFPGHSAVWWCTAGRQGPGSE